MAFLGKIRQNDESWKPFNINVKSGKGTGSDRGKFDFAEVCPAIRPSRRARLRKLSALPILPQRSLRPFLLAADTCDSALSFSFDSMLLTHSGASWIPVGPFICLIPAKKVTCLPDTRPRVKRRLW